MGSVASTSKKSIIYGIGHASQALISFILLPIYTTELSVAQYGIVSSMFTLSLVFVIISTLAIDRSLYRCYYDYKSNEDKKRFLGSIFVVMLIIGVVTTLVLWLSRDLVSLIFPSIPFHPFYWLTILTLIPININAFWLKILQIKEKAGFFVFFNILSILTTNGGVFFFTVYIKEGALGYIKGYFIGYIVVLLFMIYPLLKSLILSLDKEKIKNALGFSIPMIPVLLSSWILNLSDRVFLDNYLTQEDVGLYSLGYKIASIVGLFASSLLLAYNPLFFKISAKYSIKDSKFLLKKYNSLFLSIVSVITIFLFNIGEFIIDVFFDHSYFYAVNYFKIFCLVFFIINFSSLFYLMIYQTKKSSQVAIVTFIAAAVNIVLNYWLIPIYGGIIAAVNSLVSSFVILVLSRFFAKKNFYVAVDFNMFLLVLLSLGIQFLLPNISLIFSMIVYIIYLLIIGGLIFRIYKVYLSLKKAEEVFMKKT